MIFTLVSSPEAVEEVALALFVEDSYPQSMALGQASTSQVICQTSVFPSL